jgi:hypothetical protein
MRAPGINILEVKDKRRRPAPEVGMVEAELALLRIATEGTIVRIGYAAILADDLGEKKRGPTSGEP